MQPIIAIGHFLDSKCHERDNPGMASILSAIGIVLSALGIWQGYDAINMSVIVTPVDGSRPVANLQAMQVQLMSVILASTMFGSGILFLVGGCVVGRLPLPKLDEPDEVRLARLETNIANG